MQMCIRDRDKAACVFVVKQRLHADSVTGKKELLFLFLPHGKGVYSVELVEMCIRDRAYTGRCRKRSCSQG